MAIGNVSFGQQEQINQRKAKKETSVIKGTTNAVVLGAGVPIAWTAGRLLGDRQLKANKEIIAKLKEIIDPVVKYVPENKALFRMKTQLDRITKYNKLLIKSAWLKTAKAAGIGALVVGGIYLSYRGIKALFTSKS